jgi:hypothetical protein
MVENANDLLDAAEVVKDKTNEGKAMNSEIEEMPTRFDREADEVAPQYIPERG